MKRVLYWIASFGIYSAIVYAIGWFITFDVAWVVDAMGVPDGRVLLLMLTVIGGYIAENYSWSETHS